MVLPWPLNARTDPGRWSPHAAWLGSAYDPVYPVFRGEGSREVGNPTANGPTPQRSRFDPYDGVTAPSTFAFDGSELPADVSGDRFRERLQLLARSDGRADRWDRAEGSRCGAGGGQGLLRPDQRGLGRPGRRARDDCRAREDRPGRPELPPTARRRLVTARFARIALVASPLKGGRYGRLGLPSEGVG